jgi:hypothetical protein
MNILADILKWSKQQPAWQRDALRRLFTSGDLTAADLDELTEICKAQHGLAELKPLAPLASENLPISGPAASVPVSLISLTHHDGVNALAPEQTVSFGPNLTIVYGENAAGKSGYTRILKRACRSRFVENILGNVLGTGSPLKARATITIKEGTADIELPWTSDSPPSSSLAQISVFDSHCVPVYLRDKTDVAFRPFGLDVFDKLATACADVKKRLDASSQPLSISLLPSLPAIVAGTKARHCVDTLTSLTKEEDVRALAKLSTVDEKRLKHLTDLKRDLQASDPKKRAAELFAKATRVDLLGAHLEALNNKLGLAAMSRLSEARDKLRSARAALTTLRTTTLTPYLLPGTGSDDWRKMWDATAKFAAIAHPGATFPLIEDHAKCPFCQQELQAEAAKRLQHFAEFVTSTAQQDVRQAETEYSLLWKAATGIQPKRPETDAVIAEVSADDPTLKPRVSQYISTATDVSERLGNLTNTSDEPIVATTFDSQLPLAIRALSGDLRTRADKLQTSATSLSAAEQTELTELESRAVLHENLETVLAEIDRKRRLAAYAQCVEETNTLQTTKKSTELTKTLITDQLRQTFQAELTKIDFSHLSVEVQAAGGSKGALFHKLVFSNAPGVNVSDVLSEGESRALSLTAFLTELSTAPTRSGIIFDDPVSSLDHHWREKMGRRLVAEAKDRQVIVFTHDLLFLRILLTECARQGVPYNHQYIRRDAKAGICSPDLPWVAMSVKDRLGVLRNRWQAANKLFTTTGMEAYEPAAREIFGLLRETWERAVSEVLLNDVVERYRPSIETKKVAPLHDITESDCKAVEEGMTASSRWIRGHDEAVADGTPFPQPAALKARIDELETWVKTIRNRRK